MAHSPLQCIPLVALLQSRCIHHLLNSPCHCYKETRRQYTPAYACATHGISSVHSLDSFGWTRIRVKFLPLIPAALLNHGQQWWKKHTVCCDCWIQCKKFRLLCPTSGTMVTRPQVNNAYSKKATTGGMKTQSGKQRYQTVPFALWWCGWSALIASRHCCILQMWCS